jgi:hypothetical protein
VTNPFDDSDAETAVRNVEIVVELLNESTRTADLDPHSWEDLALLLKRVRAARQELTAIEAAFERAIARRWVILGLRDGQAVEDVGYVEVYRGKKRTGWDHVSLAAAVLDAHLSASATGEAPDPWQVRDWLMEAAGIGYWRVTPLRALGLNPDHYCTAEPGVPTVKITG